MRVVVLDSLGTWGGVNGRGFSAKHLRVWDDGMHVVDLFAFAFSIKLIML